MLMVAGRTAAAHPGRTTPLTMNRIVPPDAPAGADLAPPSPADGPAAFEALLSPLLDRAYAYALRLTRNSADAEDLVQTAALRAFRGFAGFQAGTNFRAWFFRIITNAFLASRQGSRREFVSVDESDAPELLLFQRSRDAGLLDRANPVATVVTALTTEQIMAAFDELAEPYRSTALLHFVEELRYGEVAEVLGVPLGTVRSRLHRARRMLQARLWKQAQDAGVIDRLRGEG